MKNPLISIITACFNSESTIRDTIESVLNQTYNNIEYIIIDGDSTDETVSIIKSYEGNFKEKGIVYKWISEQDKGIYDAFNKGLRILNGEWVVFIGSDDYFKNNKLIKEILPILKQSEMQKRYYVYGKIEHVSMNNVLIEVAGKPWPLQKKRFTYTMNIGHSGCFHHINLFRKHGKFNETFKIAGDYEFLLREYKDGSNNAIFIDKSFIVMREGGISGSLGNRMALIRENYKARKLNGITTFSKELFFWELRVRGLIFIRGIFGENFAAKLADLYRKLCLGKKKRWSK
ncbi:MAG: glycosyltransferase family 2 protein [Aureibaculum sp.]